jgi:hypothetical protein
MKYRRRVPRQAAGWDGICSITGDSAEWRTCRVIDISMLGLGLTLEHPSPSTLMGSRISIFVPAVDGSVNIQLDGEVTNTRPTLKDAVRVGIMFDGLFADSDADIATLPSKISELNEKPSGRHIRRLGAQRAE